MNAVGIDVSKGKSMICIMRPLGEIVASPYEVTHTRSEFNELAKSLKSLSGETKIILECTGSYHLPIARALHDADLFVCAVNPQLIHGLHRGHHNYCTKNHHCEQIEHFSGSNIHKLAD